MIMINLNILFTIEKIDLGYTILSKMTLLQSPPLSLGIMEDIFKIFLKLLQNSAILANILNLHEVSS